MVARISSLLIGYAFGGLLTAEVVCRTLVHKSSFEVGQGNPGMANVGHELGTKAALAVLAGDILKTLLAWMVARTVFADAAGGADAAGLWAGLGAALGHNYPFWHRFHGGKGVTTTCSAIILTSPLWGIAASLLGFAVVVLSGYLCVGAIAICGAFFLFTLLVGTSEQAAVALVLTLLMLRAHWGKIRGIADGTTRRATLSDKVWDRLRKKGGKDKGGKDGAKGDAET